jgi:hypothetical protein
MEWIFAEGKALVFATPLADAAAEYPQSKQLRHSGYTLLLLLLLFREGNGSS